MKKTPEEETNVLT